MYGDFAIQLHRAIQNRMILWVVMMDNHWTTDQDTTDQDTTDQDTTDHDLIHIHSLYFQVEVEIPFHISDSAMN
jgi:hypothetical protein